MTSKAFFNIHISFSLFFFFYLFAFLFVFYLFAEVSVIVVDVFKIFKSNSMVTFVGIRVEINLFFSLCMLEKYIPFKRDIVEKNIYQQKMLEFQMLKEPTSCITMCDLRKE